MKFHLTFAVLLVFVGLVLVLASVRPFSFWMLAIGVVVTCVGAQELRALRDERGQAEEG